MFNKSYTIDYVVFVMKDYGMTKSWTLLRTTVVETIDYPVPRSDLYGDSRFIHYLKNCEILSANEVHFNEYDLILYDTKHKKARKLEIHGVSELTNIMTYVGSLTSLETVHEIVCWWSRKDRVFSWHRKKNSAKSDLKYAKWFSDDSMVRTWLINSIQSMISTGYLFSNNAHLIWELLHKVYSQREDNARIFQLSNEIGNFKQGTQTLGMYAKIYANIVEKTQVYTRRHPGRQPPTPGYQASSIAPGLPPAIDSPLSGIEPSPNASIPVTTDDDSPISHSDDDRPIAIRKEKRNAGKPDRYS
ncbi:hypothetical protein GIB67_002369 [Kingdonia uniflora]|uniref:Uncharacterized protein n=1 Tax=Kingdonia uniflora TaxID=39325 RepID=A0A7J7M899_9MAGN|nr:hypothetical protein GIB67_002369 [Kingdonia uniflora]